VQRAHANYGEIFVGFAGHLAGGLDGHNVLRAGCAQLLGLDILCAADCGECCCFFYSPGDFGRSGISVGSVG